MEFLDVFMEFLGGLLVLIYVVLGYLAVPHTLWANKVVFGTSEALWNKRFCLAVLWGWLIIPWWFLKRRNS